MVGSDHGRHQRAKGERIFQAEEKGPETAKKPNTFKEGQERWEAGNKRKSGCSEEKRAEVQTMPS